MSVQSSMRDNHSCYCSLFQICWNKIHIKKFYHKLVEYSDSDWYVSKYSVSDKIIHEATDFVIISADRAATIWENEDKKVRKKIIR